MHFRKQIGRPLGLRAGHRVKPNRCGIFRALRAHEWFRNLLSRRAGSRPVQHVRPASLLLGHRVFDNANDGHEDCATDATACDVADDAAHIHAATAGCSGSHHRMEDRATHSTADNSCQGIPNETETLLLQRRAGDIAADRTADQLNN